MVLNEFNLVTFSFEVVAAKFSLHATAEARGVRLGDHIYPAKVLKHGPAPGGKHVLG
jgi:hypothetical protein